MRLSLPERLWKDEKSGHLSVRVTQVNMKGSQKSTLNHEVRHETKVKRIRGFTDKRNINAEHTCKWSGALSSVWACGRAAADWTTKLVCRHVGYPVTYQEQQHPFTRSSKLFFFFSKLNDQTTPAIIKLYETETIWLAPCDNLVLIKWGFTPEDHVQYLI